MRRLVTSRCVTSRRVTRIRCTGMCSHTLRSSWSSSSSSRVVVCRPSSARTKKKDTRRHTPRAISCPTDRFFRRVSCASTRGHLSIYSGLEGSTMCSRGWHHHHRTFDMPSHIPGSRAPSHARSGAIVLGGVLPRIWVGIMGWGIDIYGARAMRMETSRRDGRRGRYDASSSTPSLSLSSCWSCWSSVCLALAHRGWMEVGVEAPNEATTAAGRRPTR